MFELQEGSAYYYKPTDGWYQQGAALDDKVLFQKAKDIRLWMYNKAASATNIYSFLWPDGAAQYFGGQVCYGTLEANWAARPGKLKPCYFISQPASRYFRKGGPVPRTEDLFYLDWLLNKSMCASLYLGKEKSVATTVRKGLIYDMRQDSAQKIIIADSAIRMTHEHPHFSLTFSYLCQYFTPAAAWLLSFFHYRNTVNTPAPRWNQFALTGHSTFTASFLSKDGARAILNQTWAPENQPMFSETASYHARHMLFNRVASEGPKGQVAYNQYFKGVTYASARSYWEDVKSITDDCIKDHCVAWLKHNAGEEYAEQHTL